MSTALSPRKKGEQNSGKKVEKILAKDFPNLGKDIKLADSRASEKGNSKESLTRQIIIKWLKIKDKEKKKEEARAKDTPQRGGGSPGLHRCT